LQTGNFNILGTFRDLAVVLQPEKSPSCCFASPSCAFNLFWQRDWKRVFKKAIPHIVSVFWAVILHAVTDAENEPAIGARNACHLEYLDCGGSTQPLSYTLAVTDAENEPAIRATAIK